MFGTRKVVRGIQGSAVVIARRAGGRASKYSLRHRALEQRPAAAVQLPSSSLSTGRAAYSTTATAERAVVSSKAVQSTEDILHERFLACIDKGDANAAMGHFAFISCDASERRPEEQRQQQQQAQGEAGGELVALRRRQLLELMCEKGMVTEASELLAKAVASPAFDSRDPSTIASFMYVMSACLRQEDVVGGIQQAPLHVRVERALLHFKQASERGIGLALPVCEDLAMALFTKALRGEATEMEAWNVLEYVRQRGMVTRPAVYEEVLLRAMGSADMSFALRMCQHVDDEGLLIARYVRDFLYLAVGQVIKELPDTAAISVSGAPPLSGDVVTSGSGTAIGGGGERAEEWKVEGTNATVEELWTLDELLQSWLVEELPNNDDDSDNDIEGVEETVIEVAVEGNDEEGEAGLDDGEWASDVVDFDDGDINAVNVGDMELGADDVVDYVDDDEDDDDDIDQAGGGSGGARGGGEKASARGSSPSSSRTTSAGQQQEEDDDYGGPSRPQSAPSSAAPDFGGDAFCGDLTDQMSGFTPCKSRGRDDDFADASGRRRGGVGIGARFGYREGPPPIRIRRSVRINLVMNGKEGKVIVSIPVYTSVQENNDDDEDGDEGRGGPV